MPRFSEWLQSGNIYLDLLGASFILKVAALQPPCLHAANFEMALAGGFDNSAIIPNEVRRIVASSERRMRKVRAPQGWSLGNTQCA